MSFIRNLNRRRFLCSSAAVSAAAALPASSLFAQGNLITRQIPGTSEHLPVIGIGSPDVFISYEAGGKEHSLAVLRTFIEHGGMVMDTPAFLARGIPVIGELLTELDAQDQTFLVSKLTVPGRQESLDHFDKAMDLLNKRPLDLMLSHNMRDIENHWPILQEAKADGSVRYTGVSYVAGVSYMGQTPDNTPLMEFMEAERPDFVMVGYSIIRREVEEDVLPLAQELGIATLIASPFRGEVVARVGSGPTGMGPARPGGSSSGSFFRKISGLDLPAWAADYDINSWAQFALKYIVSHPAVTSVVMETSTIDHVIDNLGAAYGRLPDRAGRQRMADFIDSI